MNEFPLGDIGFAVFMGLVVGVLGVLTEAVVYRRPRALWSAQLYLRALQSPASLWWRNYAETRGAPSRSEQLLISFIVFFVIGILCAVISFVVR